MNQSFSDIEFSGRRSESSSIDFKRIGYNALKYWYLIIASLSIALAAAYFINRYALRIYPVTTSIIIRQTEETGGGEFLYKNALIDQYRNYLNEPYIIRSYPLIQNVIDELNFGIAFYKEGNFLTSEAYDYIPVNARLLSKNGSYGSSLIFKIEDDQSFSLQKFGNSEKSSHQVFRFNDSIVYENHHLLFTKKPGRPVEPFVGIQFLLNVLDPRQVAASYVGKLNVKWAEEGAALINLSVVGPNPQKEIDFLNGLIKHYQEYDLSKKNQAADRSIEFIKFQLLKISDSLKIFENQLEAFKSRNAVVGLKEEAGRLLDKLEGFETKKGEFIVSETYYQYLEKYITQNKNPDQIILPSSVGLSDDVLSGLINRMIDLQLELKLFIGQDKVESPLMASKKARIEAIKKDLLEGLQTLRSTDKIKTGYLDKQIKEVEKQMVHLPLAERQLVSIQRSYDLLENLYVFLLQKMSEAGISKAANTSDINIVNPPMQGGAISPKESQNNTIAVVLGLLLPLVFFVLMEFFNHKIQSKEDIERLTAIPFIGGIGHNSSGNNLIVNEKPRSGVAESFRALRTNMNFFTGNQVKKVFMISSSISGEGKTFTTINLATVFAMSGRKTLIIGADMRRPKIFTDFNLSNDTGLSSYLSRLSSFAEVIQPTAIENLDMVSGGPVPPNPSELLLTARFEEFLKEAMIAYDYILLDTPPLALVTDAFVMSNYADHTIFVIRQNYTPKAFVKSIDDYQQSGKLKQVSILLNDIYKSGLGYGYGVGYGYNYGYGYGYGLSKKRKNGHGYYEES